MRPSSVFPAISETFTLTILSRDVHGQCHLACAAGLVGHLPAANDTKGASVLS
jgi:hypothetical protein